VGKKTNRACKHSFAGWMERIDFIHGRCPAESAVRKKVRSDGFRQIYSSRAPTVAQSGA
jgi:hypothetical protein